LKPANALYALLQSWHGRQAIERLRRLEQRLQTPTTRLAVPFAFEAAGFFKQIRPMQSQVEIAWLYAQIIDQAPRVVVEIGTCHGGTLYLWCQAAHPDATLISIDLPHGEYGGGYRPCRSRLYDAFRKPSQTLHLLRCDSHAEQTVEEVRRRIGNRPIDFLFIDGDHTYEGARRDFQLYSKLVAPGGRIALHDIAPQRKDPSIEVWKLWDEIKAQGHRTSESLDTTPTGRCIGIGLVEWP
jgi:predicted O-methyltransferase YrrM